MQVGKNKFLSFWYWHFCVPLTCSGCLKKYFVLVSQLRNSQIRDCTYTVNTCHLPQSKCPLQRSAWLTRPKTEEAVVPLSLLLGRHVQSASVWFELPHESIAVRSDTITKKVQQRQLFVSQARNGSTITKCKKLSNWFIEWVHLLSHVPEQWSAPIWLWQFILLFPPLKKPCPAQLSSSNAALAVGVHV